MLRLLHLADAQLGARHPDLGDAASEQRERQQAAFTAAIDIALAGKVDLVLVAGNLFASGLEPRRTVERVAGELRRLAAAGIRTVILPGDLDPDGPDSVYRAYDLGAMAGGTDRDDLVTVLTTERPWIRLASLDVVVAGAVTPGHEQAPAALDEVARALEAAPPSTWRIGLAHARPAGAAGDESGALTDAAIEASGLDYLALGGLRHPATGRAGGVAWGDPGQPEQVVVDRDAPGAVLLVELDRAASGTRVTTEPRTTGRTIRRAVVRDIASVTSQAALVEELRAGASADVVLDVRLAGVRPDGLVLDPAEMEQALGGDFLHVRVHDRSQPPLSVGELPPPDTVAGAFIRGVEARIAELEATGDERADAEARDLREVLRLGRRLLAGEEVTA